MNSRRIILPLLLIVAVITNAKAQAGLAINSAFTKYGEMKGCKMTTLYDGHLKGYELKVYRSLTYKKYGEEINALLAKDRAKAKKIREIVSDGVIESGYYQMPSVKNGINRYILFHRENTERGVLIYIEGHLNPDDIMTLCKKQKTQD